MGSVTLQDEVVTITPYGIGALEQDRRLASSQAAR